MTPTTETEFETFLNTEERPSLDTVLSTKLTVCTDGKARKQFIEDLTGLEKEAEREGMGPDDRLRIGAGWWVLGDTDRALEIMGRTLSTPVALYITGRAFLESREYDEAIDRFEKALSKEPDTFVFQIALVEAHRKAGAIDTAGQMLETLRKKHDKEPALHYELGMLQELEGLHDGAFDEYERALALDENHGKSLFRLACNYDLLGEDELALEYYERARGLQPTYVNALINLGVLYDDMGKYGKASDCFREVLNVCPSHPRARMYLKDAKAAQNKYYDEDQLRDHDRQEQIMRTPVTDFELSVRSRNCLEKMNIRTLGDLVSKDEAELLAYKNFGETSLVEIKELLTARGLKLGQGKSDENGDSARRLGNLLRDMSDQLLEEPIAKLGLSLRCERAMESLEIRTIGELVSKTEAELMTVKNFGQTSLDEIREALAQRGLTVKSI